ncbi:hypothetical protein DVH05_016100 [Phytophthora capsici]|nr:hypothetical protein DVH05_016100 [Phytophthora capsici]
MSLTEGREVIDLVSSDEVSSGKEAMNVIDPTASSEEDNGESNREEETQQEKDENLAIVASASASTTFKERETK